MTSPMRKDIRKYGLEFINDLASDREVAIQSLGVAFSAMKTELKESRIVTRSEEFKYIDELTKHFREEVNRNFESQLTRITIKSLGWIKRVLMQGEKILVKDESREDELQQTIDTLTHQLKTETKKLTRVEQEISTLKEQLERKDQEIAKQIDKIDELQQQVLSEKNRAETVSLQHKNLQEELFDYQLEIEERIKHTSSLDEKINQLNLDLVTSTGEISRLKSSLEHTRSAVSATDDDVTAAMEQWAISYQQQEEYSQQTLEETKEQYEEMIKTKLKENVDQHQRELNQLKEKLFERNTSIEEYQNQISELKTNSQTLLAKKEQLESNVEDISRNFDNNLEIVEKQKNKIEQLQDELEEEKNKERESKELRLHDIQLTRTKKKADWLEKCLSYSNFAPLTILLRMGNEMSLDALAKSVGMDSIVLDNQLQVLHKRNLIDIRLDGMIVANIPSQE